MINSQSGIGLLETLIATAILSILLIGFVSTLASLAVVEITSQTRSEGSLLAREAIEIGYNLASSDWEDFYSRYEGTYHPITKPDGTVSIDTGPERIATNRGFERSLTIEKVYKDSSGAIVDPEMGIADPDYLKLVSLVSWGQAKSHQVIEYELTVTNLTDFQTLVSDL